MPPDRTNRPRRAGDPMASPYAVQRRWRHQGLIIAVLGTVLTIDTVVPWFARVTILPAGDGHLEVLNAWMSGRAVAPTGSGPAEPLRAIPWIVLILAAALTGITSGLLARHRPPGQHGSRTAALTCAGSAVLGLTSVALAWVGAAAGVDTTVTPHVGVLVAIAVLATWLAVAGAMLGPGRGRVDPQPFR